ncbi:hypothetical protein [Comamonas testosteroni]|uniref:hypothetical protein n=1 Tax=Comamonas testosteroni TaxID=285 RepID=UPI002E1638BB|nr:hypothetical protein U0024_14865 [Comamonas testosteroni]
MKPLHALTALVLTASSITAIAATASEVASVASTNSNPNPDQHIQCAAPAEAAQLDELRSLTDGRLVFKVSTFSQAYAGIADPTDPKHSMEKQVLALRGQKYFCLQD